MHFQALNSESVKMYTVKKMLIWSMCDVVSFWGKYVLALSIVNQELS